MSNNKQQRVCVVLPDLGIGGAQKVALWIIQRLTAEGIECIVVQCTDMPDCVHSVDEGINVRTLSPPSRQWPSFIRATVRVSRLRCELKDINPDTVLAMVGSTNIISVLAGIGKPWRTVISERNDPLRQHLRQPWEMLRRLCYGFADIVTANSAGAGEALAGWVARDKIWVIPNAVDIPSGLQQNKSESHTVITVARLHPQKAHDILIEAWSRIASSYPNWRLVLVGDGELRKDLEDMCMRLSLAGQVDFHGQITDVSSELQSASIFALPSRYEGTPNALLEAMAHGLACIVSDASTGSLAYVRHNQTGLVVPVEDADALSQALVRLIEDNALRSRLGQAAKQCMEHNDPDEVFSMWKDALFGMKTVQS